MSDKVVIDIEARLNNKSSKDIKAASKEMEELGKSAEKAKKSLNDLSKMKIRPHVDMDDSKFSKKMKAAEDRAYKFGKRKFEATLSMNVKAAKVSGGAAAILGAKSNLFSEGMNMGRTFSDGFKQGIESADIGAVIGSSMKNYFSENPAAPLILGEGGAGQANGNGASGSGTDTSGNLLSGILDTVSTVADVVGILDFGRSLKGSKTLSKIGNFVTKSFGGTAAAGSEAAVAAGNAGTKLGGRVLTGGLLKGTSMSAGMATGLGLAGTAGAALTVAGVVDGASDLYKGYKADNDYDKKYYKASGATKLGGTAAGAAIGTAILPGLGTVIGGGIGYLAGKFSSDKVAENYAGGAETAKEFANESSIAAQKLEEQKQRQAELSKSTLDKKFGDITLSAEEMSRTVDHLFGEQKLNEISKNDAAITQMSDSWAALSNAGSSLDKNLWMASIKPNDTKLAANEIDNLKASTQSYGESAKTFLLDSQYAAESSVSLLMGNSKKAKELINSTRDYYGEQASQLEKQTSKLNKKMASALQDGVITKDEQAGIDKTRGKVDKISQGIADQQWQSDLNIMEAKAGNGKNMSFDSFVGLTQEARAKGAEAANSYWEAYGNASVGKSEKQKKELLAGTLGNVGELQVDEGSFGLEKIKEKFSTELGAFNSDVKDIVSGKVSGKDMTSALQKAMSADNWGETQAGIGQMLSTMQPAIESVKSTYAQLQELEAGGIDVPDKVMGNLENFLSEISKLEITQADNPLQALQDWLNSQEIEWNPKVKTNEPEVETGNQKTIEGTKVVQSETTPVNVKTTVIPEDIKPLEGPKVIEGNEVVADETTPTTVEAPVSFQVIGAKTLNPKDLFNLEAVSNPTTISVPVTGEASIKKARIENSQLVENEGTGKAEVSANIKGMKGRITELTVAASELVNPTASGKATVSVKVQPIPKISPISIPAPNIGPSFRGGIVGSGSIRGFADGGFVQGGTQLATLAEEGTPEAVIPLGSNRRKRAMELFDKVGQYLKVPGYAAGGIAGGTISAAGGTQAARDINVGGVAINIQASGGQSLLEEIREYRDEIADEIAGAINNGLSAQYENMPARG